MIPPPAEEQIQTRLLGIFLSQAKIFVKRREAGRECKLRGGGGRLVGGGGGGRERERAQPGRRGEQEREREWWGQREVHRGRVRQSDRDRGVGEQRETERNSEGERARL